MFFKIIIFTILGYFLFRTLRQFLLGPSAKSQAKQNKSAVRDDDFQQKNKSKIEDADFEELE
ncbi:MAG: hypothetical protein D8M58_12335 [Calditrichaeota bacterium]|nr:MAG: hypothetical protein DWQ03_13120 [Calditrichota bacterium]MBL1206185.1 hypothetical protein [Calditrichota bacterium]